jgi:Flp pilus assembly protein TadD
MNLLLHAASSVCLFWALVRLTAGLSAASKPETFTTARAVAPVAKSSSKKRRRDQGSLGKSDAPIRVTAAAATSAGGSVWASALVAALFALHPLHVESVAWAAERKEVLCGLFWWLTLLFYAGWVRRPTLVQYLLVMSFFALGLMSKPMIVMLPAVLLLLDYWPLSRLTNLRDGRTQLSPPAIVRCVVEKAPLYLLSLGSAYITYHAQDRGDTTKLLVTPLPVRLANAVLSTTAYLRQTFWPSGLAVFYPHPHGELEANGVANPEVIVSVTLLVLITAAAFVLWRRAPYLITGWCWYLVALLPVIGIVQVGRQGRADRYTYVPLVGIFLALAWGVSALVGWLQKRASASAQTTAFESGHRSPSIPAIAAATCGGLALVACGVLTWRQVAVWRNDLTLFGHALAVTTRNDCAEMNYGTALLYANQAAEAVPHLARAVEYRPDYAQARRNFGASLALSGNVADGVVEMRKAVELDPNNSLPARDLAKILATTDNDATRNGPEALRWAERANSLTNHQDAETLGILAMAQAANGDFEAAQQTALRAAQIAQQTGQAGQLEQLKIHLFQYRNRQPMRMRWGAK